ncbi:MAG: hypothetical protein KAS07_05935, partial [Candidatus Pacebacteria bacterium]|nr:hypothetical protein [Candidatus Paceibacterota bacterium]
MAKVAGVEKRKRVIPAALIGEEWLKESGLKESALTKEIPAVVESFGDDPLQLILKSQKKIPLERLDKIAEKYSLKDILSTFFSLKIMPRPEEFERIILIKMNRKSASDQALKQKRILMDLGEDPLIPIDITYDGFNKEMAADIKDLIPELSLTKPLVIKRILIKRAEAANSKDERSFLQRLFVSGGPKAPRPSEYSPVKNPLIPLTIAAGIGSLYRGFASRLTALVPKSLAGMDKFLWAHPEFIPLLVGATALGTILTQKSLFKEAGVFDKAPSLAGRLLVTVPSSYIYSGHLENKLKKGRKISTFEDLIRQHPFLTSLAATAGIGVGWRNLKKIKEGIQKTGAFEHLTYNLKPEKLDQLYNDVVGIN